MLHNQMYYHVSAAHRNFKQCQEVIKSGNKKRVLDSTLFIYLFARILGEWSNFGTIVRHCTQTPNTGVFKKYKSSG